MVHGEWQQRRRFVFLTALFAGSIGFLVMYLFWLQIVKGFEFKQRARDVSQREVPIPAQRGEIFDRNADDPLVFNIDSFAVDVTPGEVAPTDMPDLLQSLSGILAVPLADIAKKIPPKNYRTYQPVEISSGVTLQTISYIAEHLSDFTGVSWHNKPIRSYVESNSLAHVIGYVGDITHEELQVLYNQGYEPGDVLGKSGIEKQYDSILRGKDGTRYRVVDVRERRLTGETQEVVPPVPGRNVVLTIDKRIQKLAEQALGPRKGSVVVLRPATGEILAMVSYPSFDPNKLFAADAGDYFGKLSLDPSFPFINRSIQSVYPPASTFKIIMTTAIVDDGTIPINRMVRCTGKLEFGDRVFNCWQKTGHGWEDLFGGLADSVNVNRGAYQWPVDTPVGTNYQFREVGEYKWMKTSWSFDEVLISTMNVIEHKGNEWAIRYFNLARDTFDKNMSLKSHGFPLFTCFAERQMAFQPHVVRQENYHHARQCMLNLLAVDRMIGRGSKT